MNKKYLLSIILYWSIHISLNGQTFSPIVIAAAGETYSNSQGSLSVTIGEMSAVETFQNAGGNVIINQGFQQTYENNTVPLKFISFVAKRLGKDIPITWKVADVVNVAGFDVERSFDGSIFSLLNNKPIGTTNEYSFKDNHPQKAWYRIKVNEVDGKFWYSWIESVNVLPLNINIYPNPTANKINIVYTSNETGFKTIRLIDIQGKTMLSKTMTTQIGNNNITIDITPLNNGTYLLVGLSENANIIIKQ